MSSDGDTLFESDSTNYRIIAVSSRTGARLAAFALDYPIANDFNMVYARPFGRPAIFAAGGPIIAYPSGAVVAKGLPFNFLAVTPDGRKIFSVTVGISPGTLTKQTLSLAKGKLTLSGPTSAGLSGSNCQDLAVSANGAQVYPACGAPYEFDVYSGATLRQIQTLPATPYPDNAEIDSKGDFVGGLNGLYETDDVYVYAPGGRLIGVVPTTPESSAEGQGPDLMKVSGDSTRVISATEADYNSNQTLIFRRLP